MKTYIKNYWKIILLVTVVGLVGGYFVDLYAFKGYPQSIQQQILEQGLSMQMLGVISAVQSAFYGLVLGALGILLSKKIGLWKDKIEFTKKAVLSAAAVSVISGLAMILLDIFFFVNYSQALADSYLVKPSWGDIIAMVLYGGVIEEVMLRLFFMSLVAFILHSIFENKKKDVSAWVIITANIISAMLFAAGHLPATAVIMGITPMILFRCFLLNGGIGLLLGRLYRKYGIAYSMMAHAGCHIISKFIWAVFL